MICLDVMNIIHSKYPNRSKTEAIGHLLGDLETQFPNQIVHLFIDGYPFHLTKHKNRIFHFSNDKSADDIIIRFLQKKKNLTNCILVSNDHELTKEASRLDVKCMKTNYLSNKSSSKKSGNKIERSKNGEVNSKFFDDLYLIRLNADNG